MEVIRSLVLPLSLFFGLSGAFAQPKDISIPADVVVTAPSQDVPAELAVFSGKWAGTWHGAQTNTLMADQVIVVESVSAPASARVAYAGIGRWQSLYGKKWFFRLDATLVDSSLQFQLPNGTAISCRMNSDGTMSATGTRQGSTWRGSFKRIPTQS